MDVEIVTVVIGALLGGTISTVSFYFKNKKDVKGQINELLFHLLEIWAAIAAIKILTSANFHSFFIDLIKERFPHEDITEEAEEDIKNGLISFLPTLTGAEVGNFNTSLRDKFKNSTNELAKIYPLLAFDLNHNTMLINILNSIDNLALEAPMNSGDKIIFENVRGLMLDGGLEELEVGLMALASSSGFRNKKKTKLYIEHTKNRIENIPRDLLDEYIERIIGPAIQSHYDNLGVENPNIKAEEEPTECA